MSTASNWTCRCPIIQSSDKKRCLSCYAFQKSCIPDGTASVLGGDKQAAASDVGENQGGKMTAKYGNAGEEENKVSYSRDIELTVQYMIG